MSTLEDDEKETIPFCQGQDIIPEEMITSGGRHSQNYESVSSKSRTPRSSRTTTSVSSSVRALMEARLAELRLKQLQQEQALKENALELQAKAQQAAAEERARCEWTKREAERAAARYESERAVLEAETALAEAQIRAEAWQAPEDFLDGVEPALSAQDKVNSYIRNLKVQPVEGPAPHPDLEEKSPPAVLVPLPPDGTGQMAPASGVLNAHSPPFSPRRMMEPREPATSVLKERDGLLRQGPAAVPNPGHVDIFRLGPAVGPNSGCVDILRHGPAAASHSLGPPPGFSLEPASKSRAVFLHPSTSNSPPSRCSQPAGESLSALGLSDLARVLVRCRGSESLSDRFDGNPLNYYRFMRQVDDRILNIYGQSDPGHALHLLLEATEGRARRLIGNCVMLPPERDLQEALNLLYNAFGSPQVAVRASIDAVCGGGVICNSEVGLEEFYSELVNCKIVLEAAGAQSILNSASTAERCFYSLTSRVAEEFCQAINRTRVRRGYRPFQFVHRVHPARTTSAVLSFW